MYSKYHFDSRESELEKLPMLSLKLSAETLTVEEKDIPKQISAQLHYKSAQSVQWQERLRTFTIL